LPQITTSLDDYKNKKVAIVAQKMGKILRGRGSMGSRGVKNLDIAETIPRLFGD